MDQSARSGVRLTGISIIGQPVIETDTVQLPRFLDKTLVLTQIGLQLVADVIMLDIGARKRLTEASVGTPMGSKLLQSAGSMGTHTLPAGVARDTCQHLGGSHMSIWWFPASSFLSHTSCTALHAPEEPAI